MTGFTTFLQISITPTPSWSFVFTKWIATVVIGLQVAYGRSYDDLLALGAASFFAFGIFSLPAGWLADHWSRRNMMAAFYFGCGVSLSAAGLAPNLIVLQVALFVLGVFAAIYHPVGTAMLIEQATSRGRSLAFNGVCGNVGAALAAGVTAALIATLGWRSAFLIPAALCVATGIIYWWLIPDDRHHVATRKSTPDVRLPAWVAACSWRPALIRYCAGSAGRRCLRARSHGCPACTPGAATGRNCWIAPARCSSAV